MQEIIDISVLQAQSPPDKKYSTNMPVSTDSCKLCAQPMLIHSFVSRISHTQRAIQKEAMGIWPLCPLALIFQCPKLCNHRCKHFHLINRWPKYVTYSCLPFFTARRYASAVLAVVVCPSVCLSVCLSQAGIVSKRQHIESSKQRRTVAQGI